ncbi:MAG: hypothetical protein WDK96_02810 [Candidatus Paceibacterota bacterium]|jgi:hypothetical protein
MNEATKLFLLQIYYLAGHKLFVKAITNTYERTLPEAIDIENYTFNEDMAISKKVLFNSLKLKERVVALGYIDHLIECFKKDGRTPREGDSGKYKMVEFLNTLGQIIECVGIESDGWKVK